MGCSKSSSKREVYNDTNLPQECITSHQSKWPSSKSLQTINAGKGVEKREHSHTIGGNVNWYTHYGEQYGRSLKN